jgi:hypothetical protein
MRANSRYAPTIAVTTSSAAFSTSHLLEAEDYRDESAKQRKSKHQEGHVIHSSSLLSAGP